MTQPQANVKRAAQAIVDCILYVPRGLLLPIAYYLDAARELLIQEDAACIYCERQRSSPKPSRNKFSNYTNRCFITLYHALYKISLRVTLWVQMQLNRHLSPLLLKKINDKLLKVEAKIRKPLAYVRQFLLENHYRVVWFALIPALLLMGSVIIWGWGILPEIYVFMVGSSWGGKILNHSANLLIRRQHSDEWIFLKKLAATFLGRRKLSDEEVKEIKGQSKKLILELTVITLIGKFYQFIGYCFQAFLSWLLFYMLIKSAAEEAPIMINKLEQYMSKNAKAKVHYHYENVLWLISYKLFKSTSSSTAQSRYDLLHQQIHRTQHNAPNEQALQKPVFNSYHKKRYPGNKLSLLSNI